MGSPENAVLILTFLRPSLPLIRRSANAAAKGGSNSAISTSRTPLSLLIICFTFQMIPCSLARSSIGESIVRRYSVSTFLFSSLESPLEEISLILYSAKISSSTEVEDPATIPDLMESEISGLSRPVAKIEMKATIVPTIAPATNEIEKASLVVISVTTSVSSDSSRVRGYEIH